MKARNAVARMKRVVKGIYWYESPVHFFDYNGFCNIWKHSKY